MVREIIAIAIMSAAMGIAHAQIPLVTYNSVPVEKQGNLMQNPWAGGFNSPQFSEIDLNNDGIKDLVAFERNFFGSVKTYINKGLTGEVNYTHAPEYQRFFPHLRNWMLLRDYNCDGREDIFTSVPGGIAVYRNDPIPDGLRFTLVTPIILTNGLDGMAPLYVAPPDIPSITDVDNDGDLDILSFNIIGSTLEYHKNLAIENYGNCIELEYELRNACWGFFSEDGNNNTVTLFDTCELNVTDPEKPERHAGSTVLAIDLTGNGAKDLLLGDLTYSNLVRLTNGGSPDSSIIVDQETEFPSNSIPVDITVFPASYFLDVDNDGFSDLILAPNNPNTSENYDNTWLYTNEGTNEIPVFNYLQDNFIQDGMIDLGERSYPAFFDENADGLMDIVAGSFGYFESAGNYSSRLMLLRNTGSAEDPFFEIITDDYAELAKFGFDGIYPAFGDMDDDEDRDMITGDEEGKLHYFTNIAGAGAQAQFSLTQPNYKDIDIGSSAKPQIKDINKDGLPDLLIGERGGTVKYFENTGTSENADFNTMPTSNKLGDIDVMPLGFTGFSAPFLTEDSLGNSILFVGSEQGFLFLYDNIDNNLMGTFNLVDSLYMHGVNVNVNGADINSDGKMEYVTGEFAGGIGLLKDGIPPTFGLKDKGFSETHIKIYPNPASDFINIECPAKLSSGSIILSVMNIYGQILLSKTYPSSQENYTLNVHSLSHGIYLLQVKSNEIVVLKKFVR